MTEDWKDLPDSIRAFWAQSEAAAGVAARTRFDEPSHFDDNEASANELAALVLAGRKRATAGRRWSEELDFSQQGLPVLRFRLKLQPL